MCIGLVLANGFMYLYIHRLSMVDNSISLSLSLSLKNLDGRAWRYYSDHRDCVIVCLPIYMWYEVFVPLRLFLNMFV